MHARTILERRVRENHDRELRLADQVDEAELDAVHAVAGIDEADLAAAGIVGRVNEADSATTELVGVVHESAERPAEELILVRIDETELEAVGRKLVPVDDAADLDTPVVRIVVDETELKSAGTLVLSVRFAL